MADFEQNWNCLPFLQFLTVLTSFFDKFHAHLPPKNLLNVWIIRVHRQAKFAQSTLSCFQYLGFHDHTFNRAKLANYVIIMIYYDFKNDQPFSKCHAGKVNNIRRFTCIGIGN